MDAAPDPVVEMVDIVKQFPGVRALDRVSFAVRPGEVHALVGKNGAGKSTLMHILKGLYAPDSGVIRVRGVDHDRLTTARAKEAGIALVAQHAKFIPGLTIAENVSLGGLPQRRGGFVNWRRMFTDATERLGQFGLDLDVRRLMETTTVAERQMIEIARALFADASVVILDEPTAPLPKHDVSRLFGFVRAQRDRGASFIYISHYLEEIFDVADRVTVLRNGTVAGAAPIAGITQPELIRMISGADVERYRRVPVPLGDPVLEVRGLTLAGAYQDVDLTIRAGEVVGLTGLEGSGPGAIARGLFGLEPLGAGSVKIDGKAYLAGNPTRALAAGVAFVPRDRHGLGIVAIRSVRDNTSMSVLGRLSGAVGLVSGTRERAMVAGYIETLGIKTPSMETAVENLSGGNQQKVVVAKMAATEPRLLLLDEPTQGVDVQAKVELLRIVDQLSAQGVAVGVISDELSELMDICDRIVVFYRGRIVRQFTKGRDEITAVRLLAAIEGETETTHAAV